MLPKNPPRLSPPLLWRHAMPSSVHFTTRLSRQTPETRNSMTNGSLIIATGASRGFGRALCTTLSRHILSPQVFLLIGRSQKSLEALVDEITTLRGEALTTRCQIVVADLETPEGLAFAVSEISRQELAEFHQILFFNNAGTLGPLGAVGSSPIDPIAISRCIHLNVTSPCTLISEFVKHYKESGSDARAIVVNTSSLWAVEPAASFGWYSSTKSAVEMFMEVAAEENRQNPFLRFLNYAPGPLEGEMQRTIREDPKVDPSIRSSCQSLLDRGQLVPPEVSALKCIRIAIEEAHRSGDHLDFYEQIEGIDTQRPVPTTCCANPYCQCGPGCNCKQCGAQCGACQSFLLGNR
jgi:sepiapterin reductase